MRRQHSQCRSNNTKAALIYDYVYSTTINALEGAALKPGGGMREAAVYKHAIITKNSKVKNLITPAVNQMGLWQQRNDKNYSNSSNK